jgi:hypothetical protein
MVRLRLRLPVVAVAAGVVLVVASCGDSNDSASPPSTAAPTTTEPIAEPGSEPVPEPVHGLLATIGTNRLYSLNRGFGLGLRNVGETPIVVRQIQLDSPLFETVPLADQEVRLEPTGRRFVLPVPYGEARCGGEPEVTFTAVVVLDDGEQLRLPAVEDYEGSIGRLHARECAAAHVRDLVELRLGETWTRQGDTVTGEMILEQRRPGASAAVDGARGSVMFTISFDGGDSPDLRVTDDRPTASVPMAISVSRCDPHALAESKMTFKFLAWIAVGDADPVPVGFEPTGTARSALDDLLATCHP